MTIRDDHEAFIAELRAFYTADEERYEIRHQITDDAADTLEDLLAEVEELHTASQWQPIETAPKDGTRILGWVTKAEWDAGYDVYSPRHTHLPFIAEIAWTSWGGEHGPGWSLCEDFQTSATVKVSHWIPAPPNPEAP